MSTPHTFTFETWSDTRSNRRDRTHTVQAVDYLEAHDLAIKSVETTTRARSRTITLNLVDVDGTGAPVDCDHVVKFGPFQYRWDGAHICTDCANNEKVSA